MWLNLRWRPIVHLNYARAEHKNSTWRSEGEAVDWGQLLAKRTVTYELPRGAQHALSGEDSLISYSPHWVCAAELKVTLVQPWFKPASSLFSCKIAFSQSQRHSFFLNDEGRMNSSLDKTFYQTFENKELSSLINSEAIQKKFPCTREEKEAQTCECNIFTMDYYVCLPWNLRKFISCTQNTKRHLWHYIHHKKQNFSRSLRHVNQSLCEKITSFSMQLLMK